MTVSEYRKAKRATIEYTAKLQGKNNIAIRELYIKQVRKAQGVISRLPSSKLSKENSDKIIEKLDRKYLFDEIKSITRSSVEKAVKKTTDIDALYVKEAFREAGKNLDDKIDGIFEKINAKQIRLYNAAFIPVVKNRARYDLADSILNAIDGFSDKILAYIEGELAAGKDPVKIAREIEEYLRTGSEAVLGRWGSLEVDTREYRKRLGMGGADYRTQRVVRTELYNSLRDSDIAAGNANPGATGMFNWRLSPTHIDWNCNCPDRAAGSPYDAATIQSLSDSTHPNDRCHIETVLKDHDSFINELKDYIGGEDNKIADWVALYAV
jgi:hypothetical protein